MKNIEVISRVIILKGKDILLCKNIAKGRYYLPGGHVEFGDTIEKTIYKELSEEIGLTESEILNLQYVTMLENIFPEGDGINHEINLIFTANLKDDAKIVSQESHIDFEWVPVNSLEHISFYPKEFIRHITKLV